MRQLRTVGFKRQLHIPVLIHIVVVGIRVMHIKEIGKGDVAVLLTVFGIVLKQHRQLQQLFYLGGPEKIRGQ